MGDGLFGVSQPSANRFVVLSGDDEECAWVAAPEDRDSRSNEKDRLGAFAALILAACAAASAHAGEAIETPELLVSGGIEPIPTKEVASSYTIVTAEEIEKFQYQDITDALRSVPGVHVVPSGARGSVTSVFTRGANSNQTLVLVNGMPINDPSSPGGGANLAGNLLARQRRPHRSGARPAIGGLGQPGDRRCHQPHHENGRRRPECHGTHRRWHARHAQHLCKHRREFRRFRLLLLADAGRHGRKRHNPVAPSRCAGQRRRRHGNAFRLGPHRHEVQRTRERFDLRAIHGCRGRYRLRRLHGRFRLHLPERRQHLQIETPVPFRRSRRPVHGRKMAAAILARLHVAGFGFLRRSRSGRLCLSRPCEQRRPDDQGSLRQCLRPFRRASVDVRRQLHA